MKRYNIDAYYNIPNATEDEDGEWVKWADVEGIVGAIEELNRSSYDTWMDSLRLKVMLQDRSDK